jgi:predicted DCC family thiol-disulfide oxidoreductase YuxK
LIKKIFCTFYYLIQYRFKVFRTHYKIIYLKSIAQQNPCTLDSRGQAQHSSLGSTWLEVYALTMKTEAMNAQAMKTDANDAAIVLFDGVCNLCNGVVQFVITRDPQARFKFASQQSEAGLELLRLHHLPEMTSVVLIRDGKALLKSDAVLEIARLLPAPWAWAVVFKFVPRSVRDFVYDLVARSRYSIFGRRDACWLPTPELRTRFLDA